ncbi:MAG: hypothetical protein A2Y24_08705 [Clostridiales bacterium GWE2_32_10]|nr:MAG: hypothetical protein A2Y24_08705 [Clostridiales bacterium GWE2_32_10]HBY20928.1 hypothetical protein [Clostridiales bacterium]
MKNEVEQLNEGSEFFKNMIENEGRLTRVDVKEGALKEKVSIRAMVYQALSEAAKGETNAFDSVVKGERIYQLTKPTTEEIVTAYENGKTKLYERLLGRLRKCDQQPVFDTLFKDTEDIFLK